MLSSSSDKILESSQKPNLRKAFKLLKSHACKVANFTLQWQDLEDHLRFIHSRIESKLQRYPAFKTKTIPQKDASPPSRNLILTQNKNNPQSETENKDEAGTKATEVVVKNGKEVILYVKERVNDRKLVQEYLFKVFEVVDEPGKLVLEAVQEFYSHVDIETRKSCVVLLEEFGRVVRGGGGDVAAEVREEAKRFAIQWRGKMRVKKSMEVFGFLQLLVDFGLVGDSEFASDEILKLFDFVVSCKQAPQLFRALGFADKASDYIQKLIKEDRRLEAIRFIYAFELVNQFPPVPLLEAHKEYANRVAKNIREKGSNSHKAWEDAKNSLIAALRGMIRIIESYKLGSEFSSTFLRSQIEHLKKEERKASAKSTSSNNQLQQNKGNKRNFPAPKAQQSQQKRNKHLQTADLRAPMNTSPTICSKQPSHHQPSSSLAGQGAQYSTFSAGTNAPSQAAPYAYAGTISSTQIQPSSVQAGHLLTGRQCLNQPLGNYHAARSISFTSYTSLATRPYELSGSAPNHLHTRTRPGLYERIISTDGSCGQFGLAARNTHMANSSNASTNISGQFGYATGHTPMANAPNASTNLSYCLEELLRTAGFHNKQATSTSMGIPPIPNTSSNTSGYSGRTMSSVGIFGVSSDYLPSTYHP